MTEEKAIRHIKTILLSGDNPRGKEAENNLKWILNEYLKTQLPIHAVGKCVLCKNKTEKPTINYCDECLENYNGIE